MAGGDQAARILEDLTELQASLATNVTEYLKLRTASYVLRKAIDRYREKNQGAVLSRAGAIFANLTGGNFERLNIDFDDSGDPLLVGVRTSAQTVVPIEGMSDGTRDQLYLALRVASLENFLQDHAPLPFIVDDILVNFDDERSVAALKALAELSTKTQVVFFTHHRHLVRLATQHLDSSVLFPKTIGEVQ
jgi:uncharacterized protein YhaN